MELRRPNGGVPEASAGFAGSGSWLELLLPTKGLREKDPAQKREIAAQRGRRWEGQRLPGRPRTRALHRTVLA